MQSPTLDIVDDKFELRGTAYAQKELCKLIPGYRWNKARAAWQYPIGIVAAQAIFERFPDTVMSDVASARIAALHGASSAIVRMKADGKDAADPIAEMPIKVKPFAHQVLAFNIGMTIPNIALLCDMGTGKSLAMLAIAGARYKRGDIDRMLVIAPSSVVPVWPQEFASFADFEHAIEPLKGSGKKRAQVVDRLAGDDDNALRVVVTNYEATWRDPLYGALMDFVSGGRTLVVCDESQRIKTPGAKQSRSMHALGAKAAYRAILTGTPITQAPMDFFSQYKFLDQSIFGRSFTVFRSRYARMGGFEGREIVAYLNLEELEERAHSVSYRVKREDAVDLPGSMPVYRYCELEPKARKIYDHLKAVSIAELDGMGHVTADNVLTQLLRLQQVTGGSVTDDDGNVQVVSEAKAKLFNEVLTDVLDAGDKAVVFARFTADLDVIEAAIKRASVQWAGIRGSTPQSKRGSEVNRFQTDPECKVFVAQIQTAGLGITLTAASTAIFYGLDFSFANYDQALGRVDRIGQTRKVTNVHLLCQDTVDETVIEALKRKRNVADAIVDGAWRDIISGKQYVHRSSFAK